MSASPDPVTFALLGCGRVSPNHYQAIHELPQARLAAVCDLDAAAAEALVAETPVPVYTNYHEMLKQHPEVDVVNILTPSGLHAEHALEVLRRHRRHVIVEKPMALRIEDAEAMIAAADEVGRQLHVVQQNRFNKAIEKVREALNAGRFGRLVLGTVRVRWCRGQAYYDQAPWRGTWALDGGVLTNQAVHHLDLLQWLCGDVEEISATANTSLSQVEVEDTALAWLRFANGALGAIEATTAARPDDYEASISILGEHGTAIVEGASVNRLAVWSFEELDLEQFSESPGTVYGFGHQRLIARACRSLQTGEPPAVDGHEGIRPVRLLHAIYRAIETGQRVRLADKPQSERLGVPRADRRLQDLYTTPAT